MVTTEKTSLPSRHRKVFDALSTNTIAFYCCKEIPSTGHGNVKVDANPLKSEAFALSKWGLKSEIPGPDLACKDRVLLLPLLKYYSGNIISEARRDMIGISYCCDNDSKSDLQKYIHASQVWARDFVLRASNLQNIDQPNKFQQFRRLSP